MPVSAIEADKLEKIFKKHAPSLKELQDNQQTF